MKSLSELIEMRREHVLRFANKNGAAGEAMIVSDQSGYVRRPKGPLAKNLLTALKEAGHEIRLSSFDAIALPPGRSVDLANIESIRECLPEMVFVEIKTANQPRVKEDFTGFFFAFTEGELLAAETLGDRHKVLLVNKATAWFLGQAASPLSMEVRPSSLPNYLTATKAWSCA